MSEYRAGVTPSSSTLSSTAQHSAESPIIFPALVCALFVIMIGMAGYGVTYSHMTYNYAPMAAAGGPPTEPGQLRTNVFVPALMFFTLGATLVGTVGGFFWFLRKRSNRAAATEVLAS